MKRISTPWRYETVLVVVLSLTFGFVFFDRNSTNYLLPFISAELHLSNTQIGMLSSALSLTWALSAYFVAGLTDARGHRKKFLIGAVILFSLCSFLSGLSTSFVMLLLARLLMGIAEGPILPISQSLLALESDKKRRGLSMGIMQNFGSNLLGSFAAPLILVAIAKSFNWRASFYVAGIPGLICALLVWKYVREPKLHELHPLENAPPVDVVATGAPGMKLGEILRFRNIWVCMLLSCCIVAWMVLGWSFLPIFYVGVRHLSYSVMSVLMSVLGISATVSGIVVPALSDRLGRKPVLIGFCFIGVLCPLAALYYSGSLIMLGVLLFVGWMASGTTPLFMATIPSETIPAKYIATSLGLIMGFGEIVGGFAGPTAAGWATDHFGKFTAILIMAACALVAGILAFLLKETAPVKLNPGSARR